MKNKTIHCDLHSHTWYSHDSMLKPEHYVEACLRAGINCIAVTDHNEIEGALHVRKIAPFQVIVGEEIRTLDGEVSGLFLKERIPPNLSAEETMARIHDQGGLVYIPHPFATGVYMRLRKAKLDALIKQVDVIEGWNSRAWRKRQDYLAQSYALHHGIPFAAGSDAHSRFEIGAAYMEMRGFRTKKEFLARLKEGRLVGRKTNLLFPTSSVVVGRAKVMAGHRTRWGALRRKSRLKTRDIRVDF
jgi:predicted metal-dependent phosphoesterase TrpH